MKKRQEQHVLSNWLTQLRQVMQDMGNVLQSTSQIFTQKSFFENVYAGSFHLYKRACMLVPRVLFMIKDMTPCEEQWSKMSQEQQKKALSVESDKLP